MLMEALEEAVGRGTKDTLTAGGGGGYPAAGIGGGGAGGAGGTCCAGAGGYSGGTGQDDTRQSENGLAGGNGKSTTHKIGGCGYFQGYYPLPAYPDGCYDARQLHFQRHHYG